jgi:heme/copper-type cytochrome/quinol oxidase subunit 3
MGERLLVAEHPTVEAQESLRIDELLDSVGGGPPGTIEEPPEFGGNGEPDEPPGSHAVVDNARLAMLIFLGAEAMLFAGLISGFLVFRFGSGTWPPPGQPRLPIAVTLINTAFLLASAIPMRRALLAIRADDQTRFLRNLFIAAALGTTFLAIQGSEWARLIGFGLTISAGIYGSTFYTLIGMHAAHVAAAVVWLVVVLLLGWRGAFSRGRHRAVVLCAMYWYFVVAVWPILFVLVYTT